MTNKEGLIYYGWSNYETWAVNAWLGTVEPDYERLMAIVQNPDDTITQADALQAWLRLDQGELGDGRPETVSVLEGMYADLLSAAMDRVNWREIIQVSREAVGIDDEVVSRSGVVDADNNAPNG